MQRPSAGASLRSTGLHSVERATLLGSLGWIGAL